MIFRNTSPVDDRYFTLNRRTIRNCPLLRKYYLSHPSKSPVLGLLSAIITIQRICKLTLLTIRQHRSASNFVDTVPMDECGTESRKARISLIAKFIEEFEAREHIQIISLSKDTRAEAFSLFCATRIQHALRLYRARIYRSFHVYPIYYIAASCISVYFRNINGQYQTGLVHRAAKLIQNKYRSNTYRRIFLHLQSHITMISRQTSSSPMQLLRNIDPISARNLEALSGDFVIRFRLGAPSDAPWPPRLYWKAFLKNQYVCDVSVTAPRNYSIEQETGVVDKRLWYHRLTNNPWRLIDTSVIDSVVQSSAEVMYPVLHSKDELEKLRRAKRIAWMKESRKLSILRNMGLDNLEKIATSALQRDPSLRNACSVLLDDTPTSLEKPLLSIQSSATSVTNDESVDDLLRWSETLDYDKYSEEWLATGVTASQRDMNSNFLPENPELSILGIPGHQLGAPLRYSANVLNHRTKKNDSY